MALAKPSVKEEYKKICNQHPQLPVYLQHWWMDEVCADWNVAIEYNGDLVAGVWPYQVEKKAGVSILRTPLLTHYQGPYIFYPSDLKPAKYDNFEHDTIKALLDKLPSAKVWSLSLLPGLKQLSLFKEHGFDIDLKQTFILDLTEGEETIFANLNEDHRRNIRKAEKELTISEAPELLPELYEFQKTTLNNKKVGVFHTLKQMRSIYKACEQRNASAVWAARKNGEVQAIIWIVWNADRAHYFLGAKDPKSGNKKALTALLWHAIKTCIKNGKKSFDFAGSMDPGVELFFRNFRGKRELYLILKKNDSLLWKVKEKLRG